MFWKYWSSDRFTLYRRSLDLRLDLASELLRFLLFLLPWTGNTHLPRYIWLPMANVVALENRWYWKNFELHLWNICDTVGRSWPTFSLWSGWILLVGGAREWWFKYIFLADNSLLPVTSELCRHANRHRNVGHDKGRYLTFLAPVAMTRSGKAQSPPKPNLVHLFFRILDWAYQLFRKACSPFWVSCSIGKWQSKVRWCFISLLY